MKLRRAGEGREQALHRWFSLPCSSAILLTVLTACTSQSDSSSFAGHTNQKPVVLSASILPSPLTLEGDVTVLAEGSASSGQTVRYRYHWLINGQAIANHAENKLPPAMLKRGDRVAVELTPYTDQAQGNPYRSAEAVVANTPPIVRSVVLSVQHQGVASLLEAAVETLDADQDEVQLLYRWWKNRQLIGEGENRTMDAKDLTPQDVVAVSVIPQDRTSKGREVFSETFAMGNRPPTITSTPLASILNGQFEYIVTATDPEHEPLTYALETAPSGMVIGEQTGKISWTVPVGLAGSHKVRVVTRDIQGATAFQEFSLTVPPTGTDQSGGA